MKYPQTPCRLIQTSMIVFLALCALTACHESEFHRNERLNEERNKLNERRKNEWLAQMPAAIQIDTFGPDSMSRKLTIDVQDAITRAPDQIYWARIFSFDLYRTTNNARLLASVRGDAWLALDCTEDLTARLRQARTSNGLRSRFLVAFSISSASPIRVELRAESDGGEGRYVAAHDLDGRLYIGTLSDFIPVD